MPGHVRRRRGRACLRRRRHDAAPIDEIALDVARGPQALLPADRAGWPIAGDLRWPQTIALILLPSRSPRFTSVAQVWRFVRRDSHSSRVFETYDAISEAACDARSKLIALPAAASMRMLDWEKAGQRSGPFGISPIERRARPVHP